MTDRHHFAAADDETVHYGTRPPGVTFYRPWVAFPFTRSREADSLVFEVQPDAPGPSNYEFAIELVGTEPGRRVNGPPIGWQVQVYDDGWRAFADLPGLWGRLAGLDAAARAQEAHPSGFGLKAKSLSVEDLTAVALELGYVDRTPQHAAKHLHRFECVCGATAENGDPSEEALKKAYELRDATEDQRSYPAFRAATLAAHRELSRGVS